MMVMPAQLFRFEKWYFDFALPTGEIVFFFLAKTEILGRRDCRLSLTVASPYESPLRRSLVFPLSTTGQASSNLAFDPDFREMPSASASEMRVRTSGDDLSVDLVFVRDPETRAVVSPLVIPRGKRRILWEPVHSRSVVRGSIRTGGRSWNAEGCDGYIDRLVSDVFPLLTPVRTLYWGRLHHPEGSLVYAVIPRLRPAALLTWDSARGRLEFDTVEVAEHGTRVSPILGLAFPPAYTLAAEGPAGGIRLDVENVTPAVETGFIGNEDISSRVESRVLNFLARNPRGIKFFSRGHARIQNPGRATKIQDAPFFSEIVWFS